MTTQDKKCQSGSDQTKALLRKKAEDIHNENTAILPEQSTGLSPEEIRQKLHELQVHQIELELQNEELRRTQDELDAARSRYFNLYDLAPVGYCTLNEAGLILEANLTAAHMLGISRTALQKNPISRYILKEDQDIYYLHRKQLFETGETQVCKLRMLPKNANPVWMRLDANLGQNEEGKPVCRIVLIDISESKRLEAESQKLIAAIEQSGEAIVITDEKGTIEYVNRSFENETGFKRQEALGQNPRIMKSGKQDAAFYRALWSTISRGETFAGRMVNKRKDGSLYTEYSTISPVFDKAGKIVNYVAAKRNITKYLELEERLRHAEKMEAIGQLAGGVAHDYNNSLTVILGFTELLIDQVDPDGPLREDLVEIYNAATRSAKITKQLLAFARKQTIVPKVLDLNETLAGMLKMLQHLIGEDIELLWQPTANLWEVRIDPSQVDQILANLCVNARRAIVGAGKIVIETHNMQLDAAYCSRIKDMDPGQYVMLLVSDDGCGMSISEQEKIFEPFYTTREVGEGTGLGLATVYGIIKQNSGSISVNSVPGQGTTFKIYLPRHTREKNDVADSLLDSALPLGKGETILIVEDETPVLNLATRILTGQGYTVLTAVNGQQAIEIAEKPERNIDLLLTDVIMPEMNSRELADRLQLLCPGLKVLFISGYTADIIGRKGVLAKGMSFMQKPFTSWDLAIQVRLVLDKTAEVHAGNSS